MAKPQLTIRRLQNDCLAVRTNTRGVESFDSGIVSAVEMKAVDGAESLLANIYFLNIPKKRREGEREQGT